MKAVVVDVERIPDPGKLRQIAAHISQLRDVILPTWVGALGVDPRAEHAVEALRNEEMQIDLCTWADYIEEVSRGL